MQKSSKLPQCFPQQDMFPSQTYQFLSKSSTPISLKDEGQVAPWSDQGVEGQQVGHNNHNSSNQTNPIGNQRRVHMNNTLMSRKLQCFPQQDMFPSQTYQFLSKSSTPISLKDEGQVAPWSDGGIEGQQVVHNNHNSRNQENPIGNQSHQPNFGWKSREVEGRVHMNNTPSNQNNPTGNQISRQSSIVIDSGTIKAFILVCVFGFAIWITKKS